MKGTVVDSGVLVMKGTLVDSGVLTMAALRTVDLLISNCILNPIFYLIRCIHQ